MKVKKFTFTIDRFDDAALTDDRSTEVARLLYEIAQRILDFGVPNQDGRYLKDYNGRTVGQVEVDWTEDDEEE